MVWAVIVKALAELALMALVGRFLVGLLAGEQREANLFWRVLDTMAQPPLKLARWISPHVVLDRHIPLAAVCLTSVVWFFAFQAKLMACLDAGLQTCR